MKQTREIPETKVARNTEIVGRDEEVNKIYTCLGKLYNPYVTLIGEEYIGKRTIVRKYEQRMDKVAIELDAHTLNAFLRNGSPFYEYVKRAMATADKDNTFIVVTNVEAITEVQIFDTFKDSGIPTIFISKKNNAPRVFERIFVEPLGNEELFKIGDKLIEQLETRYEVDFSKMKDEIIQLAMVQKHSYGQPMAMIEMLEKLAIEVNAILPYEKKFKRNFKSEEAKKRFPIEKSKVTFEAIEKVFVQEKNNTKIKGIYGQDEIIEKISKQLQKKELGFYDEKPLTLFFAGPTGVGKTETAKKIAETLGMEFLRVDMTTMTTEHSISRLIGSPPGYIGSQEGGLITNILQAHKKVVILFDEVEKGHPKIMDTILIPMGEGKYQSGRGEEYDCKEAIIIFTSNIGAAEERSMGFAKVQKTLAERTVQSITAQFRPEFIGRIDDVCIYNQLSKEAIKQIALDEIEKMTNKTRIKLPNVEEIVVEIIEATDDKYGAREVKKKVREIAGDYILSAINK